MVQRNAKVKKAPERWQDHKGHFDVVFTFERVVFNSVLEELHLRAEKDEGSGEPVQVINFEVTFLLSSSFMCTCFSLYHNRNRARIRMLDILHCCVDQR